jgi:hypothetical protein
MSLNGCRARMQGVINSVKHRDRPSMEQIRTFVGAASSFELKQTIGEEICGDIARALNWSRRMVGRSGRGRGY